MAAESTTLPLGTSAPPFSLPDVEDGSTVTLADLDGEVLVVAFLSAHCPYVVHTQDAIAELAASYLDGGRVSFVAISSNDPEVSPGDAPAELAAQKRTVGFAFPYLLDATQQVAEDYTAACTPDLFVFDRDRLLAYRGRLDASRPGGEPATGEDLRAAVDALLTGGRPDDDQWPAVGCSIKWRPGNEPT